MEIPTGTATPIPTAKGRYTYLCVDCAYSAGEQRWDALRAAARAASLAQPAHTIDCPGQGRLLAASLPVEFDAQASASVTPYDPHQMVAAPAWTLLIARSLAATLAYRAQHHGSLDFGLHDHAALIAEAALAFDPLPGQAVPDTASQLATLLHETAEVLTSSLQTP
ncbi:hypothetical protein ACIOBK_33550 [Micromonospora chokoriensis]